MQEPDSNGAPSLQSFDTSDDIKTLITNSDFYLPNLDDPSQPPWFSPGDTLLVDMPCDSKGVPTLYLQNRDGKQLSFTTISDSKTNQIKILSPLSMFVAFDVELKEFDGAKWRFELLSQRLPPRTSCKPNNQDVEVQFYFFVLDSRFDESDNSCGHLQGQGQDGSGGGFRRK